MDRLAALEHGDEGLDLPSSTALGLHVLGAEGQREAVLSAELVEHAPSPGLGVDGGLQIVRDLVALDPVGAIPAPVGLGGLDLAKAVLGHPPFFDQPGDIVDVDLAPRAPATARRVALHEALVVKSLADAV